MHGTQTGDPTILRAIGPGHPATVPSLRTAFAWTLSGNVYFAACQWGTLVLLARLGTSEIVGQFALAMAVAVPITLIANLQLRSVFVTDLRRRFEVADALGLRVILCGISLLVLLVVCKLSGYSRDIAQLVFFVAVAQLVDCVSDGYYGEWQRQERMDKIATSLMLRGSISLAAMAFCMVYWRDLLLATGAFAAARLVVLVAYDASPRSVVPGRDGNTQSALKRRGSMLTHLKPRWRWELLREMLWTAAPLGGVSVLVALNANIPRYAIEHYIGAGSLGIYSAVNTLPLAGGVVATALGNAAFARLARLYFDGDLRSFYHVAGRIAAICCALGITAALGSVLAGRRLLDLLYGAEYGQHSELLVYLCLVATLTYVAAGLGCVMTAMSQFRPQVPLCFAITASAIGSSIVLVPRMGLYGSATASLVSVVVQIIGTLIIVQRAVIRRREARPPAAAAAAPVL